MIKEKRHRTKKILIPVITLLLFVVVSFYSKKYATSLAESELLSSTWGAFMYVLIMMTAVIVAPFETLPLLPVAATLWGANVAAILTIVGWTIGSLVAFTLARKFGRKLVYRFTDNNTLEEWAGKLPRRQIFWLVAFARFLLPIDVISYAVGLFTKMPLHSYLAATVIGIIPFAYIFAYGSQLKTSLQLIAMAIVLIIIIFKYHKIKDWFRTWRKATK